MSGDVCLNPEKIDDGLRLIFAFACGCSVRVPRAILESDEVPRVTLCEPRREDCDLQAGILRRVERFGARSAGGVKGLCLEIYGSIERNGPWKEGVASG